MAEIQYRDEVLLDYDVYKMSRAEMIITFVIGFALLTFVFYLFYGKWFAAILAIPFAIIFLKSRTAGQVEKRKMALTNQFKELLYSLSSSMQAGRSIESAFSAVYHDLEMLYPDPSTEIMVELRNIISNLNARVPLEALLQDLAERTNIEDISTFVDVYSTTKNMGGDIVEVMKATSDTISEKIEINEEINLAIASAKFQQRVLMVVPVGVILLIRVIMPGYLDGMYGTVQGIVLATMALLMIGAAMKIGNKITNIKV